MNIINGIKQTICYGLKGIEQIMPELKLMYYEKEAIEYVNQQKTKNGNVYRLSHSDKTWIGVDYLLCKDEVLLLVKSIIGTNNISADIIKGFLFAKLKYHYDTKYKK